jgi:hypothetical protein
MFLGKRARQARKADNLTVICEPIVCTVRESQNSRSVKKSSMKREKWVVVRDTTSGGNRIYHRFEGSQALPVCPSGKYKPLTGTIKV